MILLTAAAEAATEVLALTEVAEPVQEGMNILELAMKGGWIMIVLAVTALVLLITLRKNV